MTLAELINKARLVGSQISNAWIPLKDKEGNEVDIDFAIISKDDDSCQVSHIELIKK